MKSSQMACPDMYISAGSASVGHSSQSTNSTPINRFKRFSSAIFLLAIIIYQLIISPIILIAMRFSATLFLACATAFTQAFDIPSISSLKRSVSSLVLRDNSCPAIWTTITADLTKMFLTGGQCNDDARAAIRAILHVSR